MLDPPYPRTSPYSRLSESDLVHYLPNAAEIAAAAAEVRKGWTAEDYQKRAQYHDPEWTPPEAPWLADLEAGLLPHGDCEPEESFDTIVRAYEDLWENYAGTDRWQVSPSPESSAWLPVEQ